MRIILNYKVYNENRSYLSTKVTILHVFGSGRFGSSISS